MNEVNEDAIAYLSHLLKLAQDGMIDSVACVSASNGMIRDIGAECTDESKQSVASGLVELLELFEGGDDD